MRALRLLDVLESGGIEHARPRRIRIVRPFIVLPTS
jgi:hypothetical protein